MDNLLFLQAEKASSNSIEIFKLSNISGKRRALVPKTAANDTDMESESSDSDEDDGEEDGGSVTPILQALFCFLLILHMYLTLQSL